MSELPLHLGLYNILTVYSYANRAARFVDSYSHGLTGGQAAWANRRYHGHRTLPPDVLAKVRSEAADL